MKRTAGALVMMAALGGCMQIEHGPQMSGPVCTGGCGAGYAPPAIPGVTGAWGQPVAPIAPYTAPMTARAAYSMMNQNVPLDMARLTPPTRPGDPSGIMQASANIPANVPQPRGGLLSPPGMPPIPGLPPMGPGMGGPPGAGPGTMLAAVGPPPPPGAFPGVGPKRFAVARTQVRFVRPSGMRISWSTVGPDGKPTYPPTPLEVPGRYNFLQAAIYRLKLSHIDGQPGLELYPTLEVVPTNPKTEAFLAHNAVPLDFTPEDFRQIAEGNYLVKVIYLPDPQFQEVAATGTDEIVSTRLEPGADPIKEALRRGSILLVIRMGNMDQEAPNTPPIDAPPPGGPPGLPPGLPMGMMPPPGMPMGMMPPGMPMIAPGMGGPGHGGPAPMVPYGPQGPLFIPPPPGAPVGPGGPMGVLVNPPAAAGPMGPTVNPFVGPRGPVMAPFGGGHPTGAPAPPPLPPVNGAAPSQPTSQLTPGSKTPSARKDGGDVRAASAASALPTPGSMAGSPQAGGLPVPTASQLPVPTPAALASQASGPRN